MDPRQEKIEKLRAMGLPIPLDKEVVQQAAVQASAPPVHVKDPRMLDRINQIKNGGAKREFSELIGNTAPPIQENTHVNAPTKTAPRPQDPNAVKSPSLASFQAAPLPSELAGIDDMFESNPRPKAIEPTTGNLGRNIQENVDSDYSGDDFIYKLKSRLQKKAENVAATPPQTQSVGIDMRTLDERVYQIAKLVAEQTIENVLDKFLNQKQNLNENKNTFKKYKNNIVEIEGQFYKLTPVKVKQH